MHILVQPLCDILGDAYPELIEKREHIEKVIKIEEVSFGKTLDRGLNLINEIINSQNNKIIPGGETTIKLIKLAALYGTFVLLRSQRKDIGRFYSFSKSP